MEQRIRPAPVRKAISVEAGVERAFEVFTGRIGRWWPRDKSIGQAPQADVVLEPFAGGRWFERGADGSECPWGRVLVWEPPHRVVLAWQIDGAWRYDPDLVTEVEVRFSPTPSGGTLVELEHRDLERFGDRAGPIRGAFDSPAGWSGVLAAFGREAAG